MAQLKAVLDQLSQDGTVVARADGSNHRVFPLAVTPELPGVARAASFFVTNVGWRIEEISPADDLHQWVVLRTPATPDERSFEHFVDF